MNEKHNIYYKAVNTGLKVGEPGRFRPGSQSEGQLKERSEGWSSAVANHAQRSVGGGVLFNFK